MNVMAGRTIADQDLPVAQVAETAERVAASMGSVLAGREDSIRLAIACLLSGGHLLIEDIPGVGKTLLAQALAASVGGSFHRIQGTPDLLPGDVTGTMMPHGDSFELRFRPGPIFSNIVVFDELNRANPRTQSALLEATEEGAVTVDGSTRELPSPFLLVATQNPVEMTGTYPLGEGALDRFAAVVTPGERGPDDEVEVLTGRRGRNILQVGRAGGRHRRRRRRPRRRRPHVHGRRDRPLRGRDPRRHPRSIRECGSAPRRAAAWRSSVSPRSHAAMAGRHYVVPDDVVSVADAALAHRVIVVDGDGSVRAGREVVAECLARVPAPTA